MTTALPAAHRIADDDEALRVARELAAGFAAGAQARDAERRLPHAELDAFSQSGLWAITVPRAHGGAGVSSATLAEVVATVAESDGSLGQIPQNHYYALEIVRVNGSPAQQQRLFAAALAGERFGNALSELGTANAMTRKTRLVRDGDGWRVDGRKFYATGALFAHRIPTSVIDEAGVQQLAFVPRDAPGVTVIDDWSGFGQRTTGSGSVAFDGVHVAADDVVPMQSAFDRPTPVGPLAQLMHAAIDTGIARAAIRRTHAFVREQARPWIDAGVERAADDPLLIIEVGRLQVQLHAAEALLARAGRAVDAAQAAPDDDSVANASVAVAIARARSTTLALAAGSKLFELSGSRATLAEHGLDRYWRDARTHTLHDPVRWKYHIVGAHALTGARPPRHGAI